MPQKDTVGTAMLRIMFSLNSSFMGFAGGFHPWLYIRSIRKLLKTFNAWPHSSGSDLKKGMGPEYLFLLISPKGP